MVGHGPAAYFSQLATAAPATGVQLFNSRHAQADEMQSAELEPAPSKGVALLRISPADIASVFLVIDFLSMPQRGPVETLPTAPKDMIGTADEHDAAADGAAADGAAAGRPQDSVDDCATTAVSDKKKRVDEETNLPCPQGRDLRARETISTGVYEPASRHWQPWYCTVVPPLACAPRAEDQELYVVSLGACAKQASTTTAFSWPIRVCNSVRLLATSQLAHDNQPPAESVAPATAAT